MIIKVYRLKENKHGTFRVDVNNGEWGYYAKSLNVAQDIVNDLVDKYAHRDPRVCIDAR